MFESESQRNQRDALLKLRASFLIPKEIIYLNGNSLGPLQSKVRERLDEVVSLEWGEDLITGWNKHNWFDLPMRVGEKIAPIIGAASGQVVSCDSISINLFKLLASALELRPGRRQILTQIDNFPTDLYVAQGMAQLLGKSRCELVMKPAKEIVSAMSAKVAVLMLSHVNFRDGAVHDMAMITEKAHQAGILVIWDLAHSAGVLQLELDGWGVDFAVGCGYKFLNGGPGAPSYVYVNRSLHGEFSQPLKGWMGHEKPFEFDPSFLPAEGVRQFISGTPQILSLVALESALDIFCGVEIALLQERTVALAEHFLELISKAPGLKDLQLESPPEPLKRGAQLAFSHPEAYAICRAWAEEGVIADFRAPNLLRIGFSPMILSFEEIDLAVEKLVGVIIEERFLNQKFQERLRVT